MNVTDAGRWLSYAESDLEAGRVLFQDPDHFLRQVCYLAQQSAEKALKSILVLLEIEFPFTHDLDRLRDLIPSGWRVKAANPDLAGLTIWAIEARYPADLPEVMPFDAQEALRLAEKIFQTVAEELQPYLEAV